MEDPPSLPPDASPSLSPDETLAPEPARKPRKRNRNKNKTAAPAVPAPPPPQAQPPLPEWIAPPPIPAGWGSHPEKPPMNQSTRDPVWDGEEIRRLLEGAICRHQQQQQQQQPPPSVPGPAPKSSKKRTPLVPIRPLPTTWDSPIQGIVALDEAALAGEQIEEPVVGKSKIPGAQWRGLKLDPRIVEAARAKFEELD
ncbi:hypothetical protein HDU98_003424 [Podochytrium sp. JEL0797]|nr:hypothetical protein HDU98_003424 [Podochytrium sp. JEL0797]